MSKNIPFSNKLKQYAATGAAFLLAAPISEAAVVYTDLNPDQVVLNTTAQLDLNNDGTNDIGIMVTGFSSSYFSFLAVSVNSGEIQYTQNGSVNRHSWAYGDAIGASRNFTSSVEIHNHTSNASSGISTGTTTYLGIRFMIGANTHYGYVKIRLFSDALVILDYAYEDTPDTPITAGAMELLPVELSLFKAQAQDDQIHLDWQTETEIQNAGFEIQRATENFEWETIAWQEGQGTSTQQHKYAYDDRDLRNGVQYYYRLKQISIDGAFTFSDIVSASIEVDHLAIGLVTPNPTVNGQATIEIISPKSNHAAISIFSSDGKLMSHENIEISIAHTIHDLDLQGYAKGIYFLKVVTEGKSSYQKIVVN